MGCERRFEETGHRKVLDAFCAGHRRLYLIGETLSLIRRDREALSDRRPTTTGAFAHSMLASLECRHAGRMVSHGACPKPACKVSPP